MVRERLDQASFAKLAGSRVVLTGGGSELTGVREVAAKSALDPGEPAVAYLFRLERRRCL